MAADVLLGGQLNLKSDEEIRDIMRQSFSATERGYLNLIDPLLASKASMQYEIPEGLSQYEISQKYQYTLNRLHAINHELTVGASVVLALIANKKLFIGNLGVCRALLCKTDAQNVLRVIQVTVDHNLYNEDEVLRLCQIGLEPASLQPALHATRMLGNYLGKAGYRECDFLSDATSEPILSEPELVGPVTLDDSCRFLLLLSGGLCQTLHEIFSTDLNIVNKEFVQIVVEQFRTQSTLMGVAQSVIHRLAQLHHDTYMQQVQDHGQCDFSRRHDITLLIRNFNYPIPHAIKRRERQSTSSSSSNIESSVTTTINSPTYTATNLSQGESFYTDTNSSTASSGRVDYARVFSDKKIKPYVDFAEYYQNVEASRKAGTLPINIEFD